MARRLLTIVGFFVMALAPSVALAQDGARGQPPPPAAPPRAPDQPPVTAGEGGFVLQSPDGDYQLRIGMLVHVDGRFALDDETGQVADTFAIRRARPSLHGRFARRFEFFLNPDVAGGTLVLQDAYVDVVFAPAFRVRAGKAKTPFGLERQHSASNLLFFERAFPTTLAPNRDIGIQVLGDLAGGAVSYLAGVMNGVADGGSADVDTTDSKDVSARLIVRPFNHLPATSPARGLGVAIAGSRGKQSGSTTLPAFQTQSLRQSFFSYDGASADGTRTRYSPQAFYYYKAFGGFAEYVQTQVPVVEGPFREEIGHRAWQVAASIVLTGEAATDARAGVRPRANIDIANGHWGALQLAARYHMLKVDDAARALGFVASDASLKAEAWTIGFNWYLTPNLRYVFNIERTVFDGDSSGARPAENACAFRSQIAF